MEHSSEESILDILKKINEIDYIDPAEIPNIDLYMDQVTTFMDAQMEAAVEAAGKLAAGPEPPGDGLESGRADEAPDQGTEAGLQFYPGKAAEAGI